MANCVNFTLNNLLTSYKKWIVANPHLLSDIEATVRCLSYFSFGQLRNSSLAVELIYSMPNLIVLCNDLLMYSSKCKDLKIPQFESKIKIWLTVVEYTEILLEVSAEKLWGAKGKWLIIVVIQLFKTILRLLSIHVYKERMTKSPATPPLNREKFNKAVDSIQLKEGFVLKRSGTVIRSIKYSAPIEKRTWTALDSKMNITMDLTPKDQESEKNQEKICKLAESLYVTKPLLHLGCMYITSKKQWPPWLLSFIIDIVSLNMFNRCPMALFNKEEKEELVRRRLSLLLYILRSPFYDKYSRVKINELLDALSTSVPFAKLLTNAVKKNLPYMQSMYFYMWSR
ncbi:Peroxisomal membrane protein PEX16 [Camponotus japonicus]